MNILVQTIDGIQEVLAICPCCGELFRLVEGKFIFPQKRPKACEYLELVALEERLANMDERITAAEERFEEKIRAQREKLIDVGRKLAKNKLRKIDPIFSAKDIDPQDVKVIFNPVEYLIFHGLNSEEGVEFVEFVSRSPESRAEETIVECVDKAVRNGDVQFETLRMNDNGAFEIRKEASAR